jgi:amidase
MAIRRPDTQDVAALADSYGMRPSEDDVATYTALIDASLTSYDAVEELYAGVAPQVPEGRSGQRPDDADNPLGAWYVRTAIHGAAEGPRTTPRWPASR